MMQDHDGDFFGIMFALVVLVHLAVIGVGIWAVVTLVRWLTG